VAKIIQLNPGEELPPAQRWVLVKVVDDADGKVVHQGLNATFHTTVPGLALALTEASRYADEHEIAAVYVRLR